MSSDRNYRLASGRICTLRARPLPGLPSYHVLFLAGEAAARDPLEERELFVLAQHVAAEAAAVAALVSSTRHDAGAAGQDALLLRDIDLSILGASPDRYARYERDIRSEYAIVPEDLYRQGRRRVLEHFLERMVIYETPYFYEPLESQARENLARAIAALCPARDP
ncbi:MAG TPA: hypothetical protein VJR89_18030 [Polyangiales bacterium]|nr:hypothetical protein [Polyangiales bacterium]